MSVSVKTYDFTMPANGACQIQAGGTYFRVQSATGAIKVNGDFGEASPLLQGQGLKDSPFSRLNLTNLTNSPNSGTIIIAGDEFIDQQMVLSGTVNTSGSPITNKSFNTFDVSNAVMSTSYPLMTNIRYLLFQNRSSSYNAYINFSNLTDISKSILIPPGGSFEQSNGVLYDSAGITVLSEAPSAQKCLIVQGW